MKRQTLLWMAAAFLPAISYGQVGINTATPKATLDLTAKNSSGASTLADGLLIPRIDRQRALNMVSVAPSTLVYVNDISTGSATGQAANIDAVGFYYFDGSTNLWTKLTTKGNDANIYPKRGDVKYGFQTTDHNGWFLLNGRSINSLPAVNQAAANSLFTTNLPNATERILKPKGSLGSGGGSNAATSVTIARSNLPKVNLTGTAASSGGHNHSIFADSNFFALGRNSNTNLRFRDPLTPGNGPRFAALGGDLKSTNSTQSAGAHTHSVSIALNNATSQTPLSISTEDAYLSVNVFIYLGQ